jgi:hypothetical protein
MTAVQVWEGDGVDKDPVDFCVYVFEENRHRYLVSESCEEDWFTTEQDDATLFTERRARELADLYSKDGGAYRVLRWDGLKMVRS